MRVLCRCAADLETYDRIIEPAALLAQMSNISTDSRAAQFPFASRFSRSDFSGFANAHIPIVRSILCLLNATGLQGVAFVRLLLPPCVHAPGCIVIFEHVNVGGGLVVADQAAVPALRGGGGIHDMLLRHRICETLSRVHEDLFTPATSYAIG